MGEGMRMEEWKRDREDWERKDKDKGGIQSKRNGQGKVTSIEGGKRRGKDREK